MQLCPDARHGRQPTRCRRESAPPHFTLERAICPQRPGVVWLLSTTMYISSLEVTCLPVFVLLGFSSYVYAVLEASCVQRCSRLVEARLPRVLRLQYLQSPPSVQLSCVLACPDTPRAWSKFPDLRCSSSFVMPSTRFLCGCVLWCDLPPSAAAAAFRRNAVPQERCSARACRRAY